MNLRRTVLIRAPLAHVFDRITDHEAMARWPLVTRARLVREGTPRNGLGAVREIRAAGLKLQEEIVRFDPPNGFAYKIIKGLPVDHLGEISLSEEKGAVRLTWTVRMASWVPLLAQAAGLALGKGLDRALPWFVRDTEASAPRGTTA